MGLTADIGVFAAAIEAAAIPGEAVAIAKRGFVDCIGVLLAGLDQPAATIVDRALASSGARPALFRELGASAPDLALFYGTAAHALDYDDTGLSGHPSAVLVPAVLAEAHESDVDGARMLAAYVAGYEVWADLIARDADQHHSKGWHPTAVFGTIAAAAASSVLRRLPPEKATHAVAISASLASGLVANFGSMTKPFQVGHAAQSGLLATRWAAAGLTASPDAIEHPLGFLGAISPHGAVDRETSPALGKRWRILTTGLNFKLYPLCYAAHRALDAAIDVCVRHDLSSDDIAGIEMLTGENQAAMLRSHDPETLLDAKFSLEFALACGAIARGCGRSEMSEAFLRRRDVRDFFGKVRTQTVAEKHPLEPSLAPFDQLRLRLPSGRIVESDRVEFPRGHFRNPAPEAALAEKFFDCTSEALSLPSAERLLAALHALDRVASIGDLISICHSEVGVKQR
jgi:2-methylcitrate dehydratase PrpD